MDACYGRARDYCVEGEGLVRYISRTVAYRTICNGHLILSIKQVSRCKVQQVFYVFEHIDEVSKGAQKRRLHRNLMWLAV